MLPLTVIGWVILYPILLILPREANKLPGWCCWFDNFDGDGLVGDTSHMVKSSDPYSAWSKYTWIALRNPINYFKYRVLGVKNDDIIIHSIDSRPDVKGQPVGDYTSGGTLSIEGSCGDKPIFEYYRIIPYKLFGKVKCVRIRLGWKLLGRFDKQREYISFTCIISPYHSYLGG